MRRLLTLGLFLCALPGATRGDPYWVAYEGNNYPENEGWERQYLDGGAERSLIDGRLRVDSTRNYLAYDQYAGDLEADPAGDELFVAEWRCRVISSEGPLWDQAVGIATHTTLLAFGLYSDSVISMREGWSIAFEPDVFHTFRVESLDLSSYSFYLDGDLVTTGTFELTTPGRAVVTFGDSTSGGLITSIVDWDYVHFGVIPEPSSVVCLLSGFAFTHKRRR